MSNSNNIRNMNQSNPFWDFIASMQDPRNNHSAAGGPPRGPPPRGPPPHGAEGFEPFEGHWGAGWGGPFGAMPYRGRNPEHGGKRHERGGPRGSRSPPPPPPEHEGGEAGPSGLHGHHDHKGPRGPHPHHRSLPPGPPPPAYGGPEDAEDPPSRAPTPPSDVEESREHHSRGPGPQGHGHGHGHGRGQRPHGPHGHRSRSNSPHGMGHGPHGKGPRGPGGRGGRCGMRGGHGHGSHGHRRGGPRGPGEFGGPGRHGPRGFGGPPPPFPFDLSALAEAFAPGLFGSTANNNSTVARGNTNDGMFHPELDLFDTVEAYILHMSLPGAKKPDLSITYSSARNSVTVSGVVARPDIDEEMMDALALDERKIGAFEREVKLEEGVKIDEEGISAKLEDGVLRVVVPKMMQEEDEEYVDVKRISLE